jgi:hypothetical protein
MSDEGWRPTPARLTGPGAYGTGGDGPALRRSGLWDEADRSFLLQDRPANVVKRDDLLSSCFLFDVSVTEAFAAQVARDDLSVLNQNDGLTFGGHADFG